MIKPETVQYMYSKLKISNIPIGFVLFLTFFIHSGCYTVKPVFERARQDQVNMYEYENAQYERKRNVLGHLVVASSSIGLGIFAYKSIPEPAEGDDEADKDRSSAILGSVVGGYIVSGLFVSAVSAKGKKQPYDIQTAKEWLKKKMRTYYS